jgi:hypothetical protein
MASLEYRGAKKRRYRPRLTDVQLQVAAADNLFPDQRALD